MPTQDFVPYTPRTLIRGPYTIRFPGGAVRRRFTFAEAIEIASGTDALVLDASGETVLQDVTEAFREGTAQDVTSPFRAQEAT